MPTLLWDASALAKRYCPEVGSDTVAALFGAGPPLRMVTTFPGYAETFSVLVRKRNRGEITAATFTKTKSLLRLEIIDSTTFNLSSRGRRQLSRLLVIAAQSLVFLFARFDDPTL